MTEANDIKQRIWCNTCNHETWHQRVAYYRRTNPLDLEDVDSTRLLFPIDLLEHEDWSLYQCLGCDSITVTVESETLLGYFAASYPERTARYHHVRHYEELPFNLALLYKEVIDSFNRRSWLLCAAGLRMLLEGICTDKGIEEGINDQGKMVKTLNGRINGLASIVPANIVKNIHGLQLLGNEAAHELTAPKRDDLELAILVTEDILNIIYELDYKSALLYRKATHTPDEPLPF